jgi:hypothetical protein
VDPAARQNLTIAGSGGAGAAATGSQKTGAQALVELMRTLATLLAEPVIVENAAARNADITKCCEQMTKI